MNILFQSMRFRGVLLGLALGFCSLRPIGAAINLEPLPAPSASEFNQWCGQVIAGGDEAIRGICRQLVPAGEGDDSKARYAVSGLAKFASRPGAEEQRQLVERSLLDAITAAGHPEVKTFLMDQLQYVAGRESVSVLAKYLDDEMLVEPATQALLAIGSPGAAVALGEALPSVPQANRLTVIKALGELHYLPAMPLITPYASSPDRELRLAALYALARMGRPEVTPVLKQAAVTDSDYERSQVAGAYFEHLRNLARAGEPGLAAQLGREVLSSDSPRIEDYHRIGALDSLVAVSGQGALPDLFAAVKKLSREGRAGALRLAAQIPGRSATWEWRKLLPGLKPEAAVDTLAMLAERGDAAALPAMAEALQDKDPSVRQAAIQASVRLAGAGALPLVMPVFESYWPEDIQSARQVLERLPGSAALDAAAAQLAKASPAGRKALLELLAARQAVSQAPVVLQTAQDRNPQVRLAALKALAAVAGEEEVSEVVTLFLESTNATERAAARQALVSAANRIAAPERRADPVLAVWDTATLRDQLDLLEVLPQIGGRRALRLVVDQTRAGNGKLQQAAAGALAEWPEPQALPELMALVKRTSQVPQQIEALRGILRLVEESDLPSDQKLNICQEAFALAPRLEEKRLVLAAAGGVKSEPALAWVASLLEQEDLRKEAAAAAARIACPEEGQNNGLQGPQVRAILQRVLEARPDQRTEQRVRKYLQSLPPAAHQGALNQPPPGFTALFNGRDLEGWKGLLFAPLDNPIRRAKLDPEALAEAQAKADEDMRAHWSVRDGILRFDGKGHSLATLKDYQDFEMLVDWKIGPKADSGIYLRGSPQVQIWDPVYRKIGSGGLYNNKKHPSQPTQIADHPLGEWNHFRIRMVGDRVTVFLNGIRVVDNVVMENYWDYSQPIFPKGQIELQCHGDPIEFRNIFVRELTGQN